MAKVEKKGKAKKPAMPPKGMPMTGKARMPMLTTGMPPGMPMPGMMDAGMMPMPMQRRKGAPTKKVVPPKGKAKGKAKWGVR